MLRGTKAAKVVIETTLDGSHINEDIVDEVDKAGPGVEKAGGEHGKRYGEGFMDGRDKITRASGASWADKAAESLGLKGSQAGSLWAGKAHDSLTEAGSVTGRDYLKELSSRFDVDGKRVGRDLGDDLGLAMTERAEIHVAALLDELDKKTSGKGKTPIRRSITGDANAAFIDALEEHRSLMHEKSNLVILNDDKALIIAQQKLYDRLEREHELRFKKRAAEIQTLGKQMEAAIRLNEKFDKGLLDGRGQGVSGNAAGGKSLGDRIGGALGGGSRNNAINIFGKSLGGVVNITEKLGGAFASAGAGAKKLFSAFQEGFAQGGEALGFFQKFSNGVAKAGAQAGAGISEAFSALAASGPGAIAVVVALGVAMTLLVSVTSALLALVAALAATILSALVAAVAVAGAGMFALVGIIGLLVTAFTSLTDAQQKALGATFHPLKAELTGIGQVVLKELIPYFGSWSTNLQRALFQLVPLAQRMGSAFGEAGNILTRSFSGPGFQMFTQSLGTYLPSIVRGLSTALGGFLNGMLSLFALIMPYVSEFADYLGRVATTFQAWAASATGQNAISDFIDRAVVSLHSLWDFLGAVGKLITTVFFSSEGQAAGNSIFQRMTDAVRRFTSYLSQDDRLQRWFESGVSIAISLGQALAAVGRVLAAFNQAGVIDGIAAIANAGASAVNWWSKLPAAVQGVLNPLIGVANLMGFVGRIIGDNTNKIVKNAQAVAGWGSIVASLGTPRGPFSMIAGAVGSGGASGFSSVWKPPSIDFNSLLASGDSALNATSNGPKTPAPWKNPYVGYANSLIKDGPSIASQIKNALLTVNKQIAAAIRSVSNSTNAAEVASSLDSIIESIKTSAAQTVNTAQTALNTAAQSLASATSMGAAQKALQQIAQAQRNLAQALADQRKLNFAAAVLAQHKIVRENQVLNLLKGVKVAGQTLAEYAEARNRVAAQLAEANQKLSEALSLRDNYNTQITGSVKSFGSLMSAEAKTLNGVVQTLTAADITSNLQDRLNKIRAFQSNLRLLLAKGLSNDAYKQIVDAGVDEGSAYASALVAGGTGAIGQVNSLVGQINNAAATLGAQSSTRLYQAGVDAAQGLVDGLTSLSGQLESAATKLGQAIATALRNELGIHSPSIVLREMMGSVGDGAVLGLNDQHAKVGTAASALAAKIAVSPEVAAYAARRGADAGVSGNQTEHNWHLTTNTADPSAVAKEMINEMTGRL